MFNWQLYTAGWEIALIIICSILFIVYGIPTIIMYLGRKIQRRPYTFSYFK